MARRSRCRWARAAAAVARARLHGGKVLVETSEVGAARRELACVAAVARGRMAGLGREGSVREMLLLLERAAHERRRELIGSGPLCCCPDDYFPGPAARPGLGGVS